MELVETATGEDPSPLIKKLAANVLLSPEETDFLENLQTNVVRFEKGETLIHDGQDLNTSFLIKNGWASRYALTRAGRRQILGVSLPGDFLALKVNFVRKARYSVDALTTVEVAVIEPMRILDIYRQFPVIASGLDWSTVREFNILSEHNVSLGVRSAGQRIAHFALELWCRLALVGESDEHGFEQNLTQDQLADTMGLSLVHTNKSLRKLEKNDLLIWTRTRIEFPDIRVTMEFADFDTRFLDTFQRTGGYGNSNDMRGTATAGDRLGMSRLLKEG